MKTETIPQALKKRARPNKKFFVTVEPDQINGLAIRTLTIWKNHPDGSQVAYLTTVGDVDKDSSLNFAVCDVCDFLNETRAADN